MTDDFAQAYEDKFAASVIVDTPPVLQIPSMDTPPDPVQPKAPEVTEKQLLLDPKFAASARDIHLLFEGEPFDGDDQAAARYGIDAIGEFNYNFAGPAGIPGESGISSPGTIGQAAALLTSGSQDQAKAFVYLMDRYDQLPNFTLAGTGRMIRGMVADPSVYTGFGTLGLGFAARKTGAMGIKRALVEIAKRPGASAAVYTGVEAGAADQLTQAVEKQAGYDIDPVTGALRTAITSVVGGAAGGGLVKGGEMLAREFGPAVGEAISQAGQSAEARMAERGPITDRVMSGADPMEVIDPALAAAGKLVRQPQTEANPNRISTRLPTAKGATEDPIAQPLQIGLDEVAADPVVFEHNVGIVKNYPNMTEAEAALPPAEASKAFIEHAKNNLLWVFDKVPEQTRERSKKWYDGARAITDRWSEKYNLPDSSIAGVLAALSPQKDWYMNVSLGERVLDIMSNQQDTVFTKEMLKTGLEKFNKPQDQAIIKAISNKKLSELELPAEKAIWLRLHDETYGDRSHQIVSPEGDFIGTAMTGKGEPKGTGWGSIVEISKAVSAFESGGDKNVLTPLMGTKHKVRSFYNNILDPNGPNGDVTIDTHAVAAALLRPLSGQATEVHHNFGSSPAKAKQGADWLGATKNSAKTGVQGNYGLYAEAYRRAAAERGVLPREMQSITWEAVRGLFTDKFKGQAKNVEDVNNIWYKYRKGEVTLDEARNAVEQRAGGINPPTWQRPSGAVDEQVQNTAE